MKNKLFTNIKVLSSSVLLAMAVASSANAATFNFGNAGNLNGVAQLSSDDSKLTSVNVPASNLTNGANGFFVETFDQATQTLQPDFLADGITPNPSAGVPFPGGATTFNEGVGSAGCAVNGTGAGITITESNIGSSFGVRKLSGTGAAAPAGDTSCFGYTPKQGGTIPSWVEIDYAPFLLGAGDVGITFLGFYWGSIDTFNDFTFYDNLGAPIQTITGSSLLTASGGTSGNQTADSSNLYVAIDFALAEAFTKLRITTNGIAGEFDNVVIGLQGRPGVSVPAPSGVALLGLGLLGLGLRKRLRK
jgi:hypothetical protein